MNDLKEYLEKRGVSDGQMAEARQRTQAHIDAYRLREEGTACNLAHVELAKAMEVSRNRISRIENGDINAMDFDSIQRYIEVAGGSRYRRR